MAPTLAVLVENAERLLIGGQYVPRLPVFECVRSDHETEGHANRCPRKRIEGVVLLDRFLSGFDPVEILRDLPWRQLFVSKMMQQRSSRGQHVVVLVPSRAISCGVVDDAVDLPLVEVSANKTKPRAAR